MDKPFVTVSVLTFNSSKTVKDTLDSIYNQTYPNLDLIISDDCSTDKTISICRKWIETHKDRFNSVQLLTVTRNTGVTANINRAWSACKTDWNKDIAGDDILLPSCIDDYVSFVEKNPDAIVIFSRIRLFRTRFWRKVWFPDTWHDFGFFELDQKEQLHYLVFNSGRIPTCSAFYNLSKISTWYRHDERIPLLEDDPKWIVFAQNGIKFHLLNKETVGYRCSIKSLSNGFHSPRYYNSRLLFYLYYYLDAINYGEDRDKIYKLICDEAIKSYNTVYSVTKSLDYRIGQFLLYPFRLIKRIYFRLLR